MFKVRQHLLEAAEPEVRALFIEPGRHDNVPLMASAHGMTGRKIRLGPERGRVDASEGGDRFLVAPGSMETPTLRFQYQFG